MSDKAGGDRTKDVTELDQMVSDGLIYSKQVQETQHILDRKMTLSDIFKDFW